VNPRKSSMALCLHDQLAALSVELPLHLRTHRGDDAPYHDCRPQRQTWELGVALIDSWGGLPRR
jgi:hypothetical protein